MSVTSVTSEALQLKLRQLLPSQQGFGTDLSASDTIVPIIDLTEAAEGSDVPRDLQTALAFGSQTEFSIENASTTIINTTGFYRVFGVSTMGQGASGPVNRFQLSDGATQKTIWRTESATSPDTTALEFDFVVFLAAGESLIAFTNQTGAYLYGSTRQIADINGTLVNPVGFTPS